MALPDATDTPPVARMSVVRGTLRPARSDEAAQASATAAAELAAKQASQHVPGLHDAHLSHVDVLWQQAPEGGAVQCTVTLRAHARTDLDGAATCDIGAMEFTPLKVWLPAVRR